MLKVTEPFNRRHLADKLSQFLNEDAVFSIFYTQSKMTWYIVVWSPMDSDGAFTTIYPEEEPSTLEEACIVALKYAKQLGWYVL